MIQPQFYSYNNNYTNNVPPIVNRMAQYNNVVQNNVIPQPGSQYNTQAVPRQSPVRTIYKQMTTKNKSFLDMHHYLKATGHKNNAFMLALYDPDLDGIDPHDPNLNTFYKQKVFRECMCNYWYFLREVVRIPSSGAKPMMYKLTRGNMALTFCQILNMNVFMELPRQQGKSVSSAIRFLYVYNFATTNSKIAFLHKNMDGAKDNLQTLKDLRDLLPPYLIMKEKITPDGKVLRGKNNTTEILNPFNNNDIKVFASATNKAKAASLLRGKTLTMMWYDEYGFLPYNDVIYMNAAPAYKTAAMNAKANGAPFGILITTTPGFMSTDEGKEAYHTKENATKFSEEWYDYTYDQMMKIITSNTKSDFVYIRYTYQELGCSEQWFKEVCVLLKGSWPDIRREILLEWSTGVENSPFREEDLDTIAGLVRQPISITYLLDRYRFETYLQADTHTYPALIGVDVAASVKRDSSTITVVDSLTTKVLGCLNCNYITQIDLCKCLKHMIDNWMPNAIINVERNGVGQGVIGILKKMGLTKNLYYEIKDTIVEERQDGVHSYKQKVRTKVYGLNSTAAVRQTLIDILMERVENHKDKIVSPIIYNELLGMEIKKTGKVEHSASTHDDQVFSMLMALYMWYYGVNMAERFGLKKTAIKTDDDIDDRLDFLDEEGVEIVEHFNVDDELAEDIQKDLDAAIKAGGTTLQEFINKRREEEAIQFNSLVSTKLGERAYRQMYNIPDNIPLSNYIDSPTGYRVPDSVFNEFYSNDGIEYDYYSEAMAGVGAVPEGQAYSLNNDDYKYTDHFNF